MMASFSSPLKFAISAKLVFALGKFLSEYSSSVTISGNGQRLTSCALRTRFDKARKAAGVSFQFRDIRAKTATDIDDLPHAQKLLGHKSREMTEHYTRHRKGEKVSTHK